MDGNKDGEGKGEEMEKQTCTCLLDEDCKQHDLTPAERMAIVDKAILKVRKFLDGHYCSGFPPEEYMDYFSCVHFLCSFRYYRSYTIQLYGKFIDTLEDCILDLVLPSLEGKKNTALLMEMLEIWPKYKDVAHWLLRFFYPMKYYCLHTKRVHLNDIPFHLLCAQVIDPLWTKIEDGVIRLINGGGDGGVVLTEELAQEAINFLMEIEKKGHRNYFGHFQQRLLADAAHHYFQLGSAWLLTCSFHQYMRKAQICLHIEVRRLLSCCLPYSTITDLLEVIRFELFDRRTGAIVELLFRGV